MILGVSQSALSGILILRLGYLQILKHEDYKNKSDSNRIKPVIKPAGRGTIFDRYGQPLTRNENNFRLLIYLDRKIDAEDTIGKICKIIEANQETKEIFLAKIKNAKRKKIISLIDNLGWDDLARIETNFHMLPGISIESGIIRRYPYPNETAHFIGYVSLPAEKEIEESEQNLFLHPDFRIGKFGIEKSFDNALRGRYGVRYVEVNVHEVPLRTLSIKQPIDGSRLTLTIDFSLQKFVTQRIKDIVASVVVMDVKTGEILSYASSPSFDPNNFVEGISREYWKELNEDKRKPLSNKPISALYPPGSTYKLMVALAGLKNGFNPNTRFFCNGFYQLGKRTFHCWEEKGHGSQDLVGAIKHSCNVYFYNLASQVGYEKFNDMAKKFGFGEKFDISLYGSKAGLVPDEEWKTKIFNQPWVKGDTLNTAIGQGNVLATPLQLAIVASRIANGGVPIRPYLVKNNNIFKQYDALKNEPIIEEKYLKLIQEGMTKVVNEAGGTAFGKKIYNQGFEMAGKTGTSQVISKREKEMSKTESEQNANHAIFIGYAPIHDPKYAISVVVEHGKSGSMAAAPIAKDVFMEVQGLNKILNKKNTNIS